MTSDQTVWRASGLITLPFSITPSIYLRLAAPQSSRNGLAKPAQATGTFCFDQVTIVFDGSRENSPTDFGYPSNTLTWSVIGKYLVIIVS